MRGILLALLAGLVAVTAPPAAALCADDGNGGCSAMRHDVLLEIRDDCADGKPLCLVVPGADGVFVPSGGILNLTVVNHVDVPLDFELFITARFDDAAAGAGARPRADRILRIDALEPGERQTHEVPIDAQASALRFQALASDQRQAELDADVTPVLAMTGGSPEVQADVTTPNKGAPAIGFVAGLALLAMVAATTRRM